MVSLAAVFDFKLKLRVLFPKDLGCVFCCNRAAKKFPVGLFDGGNCLVDNLYYGTRLRVWVSIATVGAMFKLTVLPALLKSML
jgi:ABC-type dipeptide/oligopeptide/nickel transport system permease subunit